MVLVVALLVGLDRILCGIEHSSTTKPNTTLVGGVCELASLVNCWLWYGFGCGERGVIHLVGVMSKLASVIVVELICRWVLVLHCWGL